MNDRAKYQGWVDGCNIEVRLFLRNEVPRSPLGKGLLDKYYWKIPKFRNRLLTLLAL